MTIGDFRRGRRCSAQPNAFRPALLLSRMRRRREPPDALLESGLRAWLSRKSSAIAMAITHPAFDGLKARVGTLQGRPPASGESEYLRFRLHCSPRLRKPSDYAGEHSSICIHVSSRARSTILSAARARAASLYQGQGMVGLPESHLSSTLRPRILGPRRGGALSDLNENYVICLPPQGRGLPTAQIQRELGVGTIPLAGMLRPG